MSLMEGMLTTENPCTESLLMVKLAMLLHKAEMLGTDRLGMIMTSLPTKNTMVADPWSSCKIPMSMTTPAGTRPGSQTLVMMPTSRVEQHQMMGGATGMHSSCQPEGAQECQGATGSLWGTVGVQLTLTTGMTT